MTTTIKTIHSIGPDGYAYVVVDSRKGHKKFSVAEGQATKYIKKNYRGSIESHGRLYEDMKDKTEFEASLAHYAECFYAFKFRPMSGGFIK